MRTQYPDFLKAETNKNDFNNLEFNKNNLSNNDPIQSYQEQREQPHCPLAHGLDRDRMWEINSYRKLIEENIEYDYLIPQYSKERMDELVELIADIICGVRETTTVSGDDYPGEVVKNWVAVTFSTHLTVLTRIPQKSVM